MGPGFVSREWIDFARWRCPPRSGFNGVRLREVGFAAGQDPDVDASVHQCARDRASDKAGCPCDENFHFEDVKGETGKVKREQ